MFFISFSLRHPNNCFENIYVFYLPPLQVSIPKKLFLGRNKLLGCGDCRLVLPSLRLWCFKLIN